LWGLLGGGLAEGGGGFLWHGEVLLKKGVKARVLKTIGGPRDWEGEKRGFGIRSVGS